MPLVLRILQFMDTRGYARVVPRWRGGEEDVDPCPQVGLITSAAGCLDLIQCSLFEVPEKKGYSVWK